MRLRTPNFLRKNDCFVAGFYTTVRNMLAYHVRTEIAKDEDAKELPVNWQSMLPGMKAKLLAEKRTLPTKCSAQLIIG
jgi:hypothetical protein